MYDLTTIFVALGCGCVLPIMVVWFMVRESINKTNQRTQIVLAALEKNPNMDIEDLLKKISPKPKLLKEKLLSKLLWGWITTLLGIGLIGCHFYISIFTNSTSPLGFAGVVLLAVGVAYLVNYAKGKKMLAKEIEAEEKLQIAQAESR